jgi:hypothetical protein
MCPRIEVPNPQDLHEHLLDFQGMKEMAQAVQGSVRT